MIMSIELENIIWAPPGEYDTLFLQSPGVATPTPPLQSDKANKHRSSALD